MRPERINYDVTVGQTHITLRKRGQSEIRTGVLLGSRVIDGQLYCYADRLLLAPGEHTLTEEWSAEGCVSTILTRRATAAEIAAGGILVPADQLGAQDLDGGRRPDTDPR